MYTQIFRRATVVALLLVGSLSACKQNNDPAPAAELSSRVAGQYTLTHISANGQVASAEDEDLKGGARLTRVSATSVSLDLDISTISSDESVISGSVSDVKVTDAGNNEVNLVKGKDTIGKGDSNTLVIKVTGGNGVSYGLIMTK